MNIFRTATGQAIREIISEHGQENRFGRSLTDTDIDSICGRIVDLFEMTLSLRAQVAGGGDAQNSARNAQQRHSRWEEEPTSLPSTRSASEIYDFNHLNKQGRADALPHFAPQKEQEVNFKLPRKRVSVSTEEQEILMRRSQSPAVAQRPAP